jgi:hypothetical protein
LGFTGLILPDCPVPQRPRCIVPGAGHEGARSSPNVIDPARSRRRRAPTICPGRPIQSRGYLREDPPDMALCRLRSQRSRFWWPAGFAASRSGRPRRCGRLRGRRDT